MRSLEKGANVFSHCDVIGYLNNFKREEGTRCSLVEPVLEGKDLGFGPDIEQEKLIDEASSGDESEESSRSIFPLPPKLTEVLN